MSFAGGGGSSGTTANSSGCPPPVSTASAGNADVSAQALGKGLDRTLVIRLKDKQSGVPLKGATVSAQGQMTFPHTMLLIDRPLHEISSGTYRGQYAFIMKGDWTVIVDVTDKKGKETKRNFPVVIG